MDLGDDVCLDRVGTFCYLRGMPSVGEERIHHSGESGLYKQKI